MSEPHEQDDDDLDDDELDDEAEGEDDQDDLDEQDEDAELVKTNAAAVRAAQRSREPKEAPASQRVSARRSPFDKPPGAEWGLFFRVRDGVTERLRLYNDAEQRWIDAFPVSLPLSEVLQTWGGGRYTARWYAKGKIISSGPFVDIGAGVAAKHKDARFEAPAPAPPPPAPAAPPPAPIAATPPPPMLPQQAPTGIAEYLAWQAYFEERERRASEYRIQLEREAHARALELITTRNRLDLEEAEARNQRAMAHQASLTKQLLEASRAASDVSDLERRLASLEDAPAPAEQASEFAEIAQAIGPVISELIARKKGPTP